MVNEVPKWLKNYLDEKSFKDVEQAIFNAEQKTSGEIVPMIVKRSITVGHVPVILFCIQFIVFFCSGAASFQSEYLSPSPAWWLLDIIVFSFAAVLASKIGFFQRHLTSDEDITHQVHQRACVEFYEAGLNNTMDATGVLIFLSLTERRVVVLADKGISAKIHQMNWVEVVETITKSANEKALPAGFVHAISKVGDLISPYCPVKPKDKNEIGNHLLIKE